MTTENSIFWILLHQNSVWESIFGKYLCQTNISKYGKEITQSVLKQIRIALVVLFAFTKETFLPKG
jgi:hypothetical protein